jgi:hypothetical protein
MIRTSSLLCQVVSLATKPLLVVSFMKICTPSFLVLSEIRSWQVLPNFVLYFVLKNLCRGLRWHGGLAKCGTAVVMTLWLSLESRDSWMVC